MGREEVPVTHERKLCVMDVELIAQFPKMKGNWYHESYMQFMSPYSAYIRTLPGFLKTKSCTKLLTAEVLKYSVQPIATKRP